jgi:cell shape-determining protein MreC
MSDDDEAYEIWAIPSDSDEKHQSTVEFLIEFQNLKVENERLRKRVYQLEERLAEALN